MSISGSAGGAPSGDVDLTLLRRCHAFVRHLTLAILHAGGDIVAFVGQEPLIDPTDACTGKIFYWSQVEAIAEYLPLRKQTHDERPLLHAVVSMDKPQYGIPQSRQTLWQKLLTEEAVALTPIPVRYDVGGHHRERQAEAANVLVALGGGKGVYELDRRFRERGAAIIPLDARIGSSCDDGEASFTLNREALLHPERFVPTSEASWFRSRLPLLSFDTDASAQELAQRVLEVLFRVTHAVQPPPMPVRPVARRDAGVSAPLHFLVLADEWLPQKGGLSTLNRELCLGLAHAGHRVSLFLPRVGLTAAALEELKRESGIFPVQSRDEPPHGESELLLEPALHQPPDIIIGHGQITGPAAWKQQQLNFPRSLFAYFVHTSPPDSEHRKGKAPIAAMRDGESKDRQQAELAGKANLVVAVGPRLKRSIEQSMYNWQCQAPVFEFLPWLPKHELVHAPKERAALWIGRADAAALKGLDLAVRALARLPMPLLYIRGVKAEEAEPLREQINLWSKGKVESRFQEYTSDLKRIEASFRCASVVLMPSRAEGFGLVGIEAIARGIPALVSSESGLAELLRRHGNELGQAAIVQMSQDDDESVERLYQKLRPIWESPEQAFAQARALREGLDLHLDESRNIAALLAALREQIR